MENMTPPNQSQHPVLGVITIDPIGLVLNTGFNKFSSCVGVDGLAKWDETTLELLSVVANQPGTGQFRQFMDQCRSFFQTIIVWEVWNDALAKALIRYGFSPHNSFRDEEILNGYKWTA